MLTIGIVLDGFSSFSGIIYTGIRLTLASLGSRGDSFIFVGEGNRGVKPPRPSGRAFAAQAYAPGKENGHFCIAPLDPAFPGGGSALRQHFVRGEHAGQRALAQMAPQSIFELQETSNILTKVIWATSRQVMTKTQGSTKLKEDSKKGWLKRLLDRLAKANQQSGGRPPSC